MVVGEGEKDARTVIQTERMMGCAAQVGRHGIN